jgi:hypothetical protein
MSENNINKSIDSNTSSSASSKRNPDLKMSDDETAKSKISKSGWLLKWTNYLKGEQLQQQEVTSGRR